MAVRLLERSRISPSPSESSSRLPIRLTFFDIIWLNSDPVERLFFFEFPHTTDHFLNSHLPLLKSSLSLTLAKFYPLAGTILLRPGSDHHFEICFADTDSVPLTICEFPGVDFAVLSGDQDREIDDLLLLVPKLPKSLDAQPLLTVQVTLFPPQGLCLALAVHHAACDGLSSTRFVKSWASDFRSSKATPSPHPSPFIDRSVIPDPRGLYSHIAKLIVDMREQNNMFSMAITGSGIVISTFTLKADHIAMLKQQAQSSGRFHCSSFVVSSAYAWVCLLRTRGSVGNDLESSLMMAVDWRRRIRPRVAESFFGNCIGACFVTAAEGEIVGQYGFPVACEKIGLAIEGIGDDVHEAMDGAIEKIVALMPTRPLTIAGSPKLRVYETDFGWGKLKKVEVTSIRAGAISMAESRDEEGGVEIGIVLAKKEMKEFARHFVGGLDS